MRKINICVRTLLAAGLMAGSFCTREASAQLCLQMDGPAISVNFNGLAVSGTSNNVSTLPIGWAFAEAGTSPNITYAADDGSSSTANTYSFGTGTNTDRALGEITGSLQSTLGGCMTNNTGAPITGMIIGYTGEQWRLGDSAAPIDKLNFQYSLNATSLIAGTYIDVDELDFSSPNNTTVGALNGNNAGNRTVFLPVMINFVSPVPNGASVFFRWVPLNAAGANDGLAIDDFTIQVPMNGSVAACTGDTNNSHTVDVTDLLSVIGHWGPCP